MPGQGPEFTSSTGLELRSDSNSSLCFMNMLQVGSARQAPALVLSTGPKCSSAQGFMKFCTKKKDSSGPRKLSRHRICFTDPEQAQGGQAQASSALMLCTSTLGLARTKVTHVFFAQLSDLQKICKKGEKFSSPSHHLQSSPSNDVKEHFFGSH